MDLMVSHYLAYLAISVALTIWVARTLHKNGRIFLVDAFGTEALADSINHLLVVGFYLLNFGYDCYALTSNTTDGSLRQLIETLSKQIGGVLLVLGGMHFFNLYVFSRIRRRATVRKEPIPVAPSETIVSALPVS